MNRLVLKIILLSVMIHYAFSSIRLIASLDALAYGASSIHVGLIISMQALAPVFFAVSAGRWIDNVGTHKPMIFGSFIVLAGVLIPCLFLTKVFGLTPLYVTCLATGFGYMFVVITTQQLVGVLTSPEHRTTLFSWLALGYSTSGLVAPAVSGFLIDTINHRAAYSLAFILGLLGFVAFLICKKGIPDRSQIKRATVGKGGYFALMKIPQVRKVIFVSAVISMAWDLQHFMFPVYGHSIGLSASEIGILVSTFFSATFLVRLILPILSRHITEWQFIKLVMLVAAIGYFIFPFFTSFSALLIVAFVLGLGLGCAQPNVMSLVHRESPEGHVGEALGLRTMMINASHSTLPSIFGVLTAAVGVSTIFFTMTGVFAFTSYVCRDSKKRRTQKTEFPIESNDRKKIKCTERSRSHM